MNKKISIWLIMCFAVGAGLLCCDSVKAEIGSVQNPSFEADNALYTGYLLSMTDDGSAVQQITNWTLDSSHDLAGHSAHLLKELIWGVVPEDVGTGEAWLCLAENDWSDPPGVLYQDLGTTVSTGFYVCQLTVQSHTATDPITQIKVSLKDATNPGAPVDLASIGNADILGMVGVYPTPALFAEVTWTATGAVPLRVTLEALDTGTGVYGRTNVDDIYVVNEKLGAHNPSPNREAADVSVGALLSWTLAEDPNNPGATNPDITGQDVYLGTDFQNMAKLNATTLGPSVTSYDPTLEGNKTYYWRVDTHVTTGTITGTIWRFSTELIVPIITDQPDMVSIAAGQGLDAVYTVQATNPISGDLMYQWFRDPNILVSGDDIELEDGADYSGSDTNELTIIDVETTDNNTYYYCQVSNVQGWVLSDAAQLAAGTEQYRWTFDNTAVEYYGSGFDGVMNAGAEAYETDAMVGTHALRCDGDDRMVMGDVPLTDNGHFGLSMWTKVYNPGRWWAALCGKTVVDWLESDFWLGCEGHQFIMRWAIHNPDGDEEWLDAMWAPWMWTGIAGNPRWLHIVLTYDTQKARIYYDGQLAAEDQSWARNYPLRQNGNQFYVGQETWRDPTNNNYGIDALIDDIRLYNYALSDADILKLYADVTGLVPCENPPAGDTNGDCKVDMDDLANVAASWLSCNAPTPELCEY